MRALHYYLDKTKDLRAGKELVFVSFRKSFNEDIVPVTVSLAQTLHQVRTHDVCAFAVPAVCFDPKGQMRDHSNFCNITSLGILGTELLFSSPLSIKFQMNLKKKGRGERSRGC